MPRLIPLPTKWPVEIVQSVSNVDAYLGQHCRELRGREGLFRMCEQPSRLRCACTAGVVASRCHIREALALWLDRDPEGLVIAPEWPRELVEIATEVSQARHDASAAAHKTGATTAKAAKKLDRIGLSRRDAADVLAISHQRVQQLLDH
jgi:hypothetical protein